MAAMPYFYGSSVLDQERMRPAGDFYLAPREGY